MAISESARADIHNVLSDVIGSDRAETLMSAIRLHDLDAIATKGDLAVLKGDLAVLKSDLAVLKAELTAELALEIDALRGTMTNWMFTQSLAIFAAIVGVAFLT